MVPIKDIGQLNDSILGDRKQVKLTAEASSEARVGARDPVFWDISFLSFLKQSGAERAQR